MGMSKAIFACGIIACCSIGTIQAIFKGTPPTAQINNSRIIGKKVTFAGVKVHQFAGVPFAQPPVGPLRFQKPQPIQNYPAEFKALTNPPVCMQYSEYKLSGNISSPEKSEDCLYMNIWTPADASPKKKKAVLYWTYDVLHMYDSKITPIYNGTRLAALGDIIVVTINYRIGSLGFLTSNSSEAPGNVGFWDVLEGLRWVNKYIEAFGGDVSRITLGGQRAGAIDVGLLGISPLAKDLFARQIMQSGSPAYRRADDNAQSLTLSQRVAKYVGCATDNFTIDAHSKEVLKCLQGVDADVLSKADFDIASKDGSRFIPKFGDEILPANPREEVINDNFRCNDLLIGDNKDEGSYILSVFEYQDYFGFHGEKNPHVNRSMGESMIRKYAAQFPDPEAIVDYYLPPALTDDTDYRIRTQVYTMEGDIRLLCPTVYYAEKCAEQGRNVYFYFFTHRPSNSIWAPWQGVTYFDEVQFVFGQPIFNPDYDSSEYLLSKQMVDIWTSFVKNGKPSIPWPLYSKENRSFKYIGPDYVTGENGNPGPHAENCEFLKSHFGF